LPKANTWKLGTTSLTGKEHELVEEAQQSSLVSIGISSAMLGYGRVWLVNMKMFTQITTGDSSCNYDVTI